MVRIHNKLKKIYPQKGKREKFINIHARRGTVSEAHSFPEWAMMLFFIDLSVSCFMHDEAQKELYGSWRRSSIYLTLICFYPIREEWAKYLVLYA